MSNTRGRKRIEINADKFQKVVDAVEDQYKPTTRSQLWKLVEETEWAKNLKPRPLTQQVAMLRAEELGIKVATPKGKRGRTDLHTLPKATGPRNPSKKRKLSSEAAAHMKATFPSMGSTVDKAATGSMKAVIKLMCMECSSTKKEVSLCSIKQCPLWGFRPYQGAKDIKAAKAAEEREEKRLSLEVV